MNKENKENKNQNKKDNKQEKRKNRVTTTENGKSITGKDSRIGQIGCFNDEKNNN